MLMKSRLGPKFKYIVGIDEVGRGPLAGPVAVCACLIPYHGGIQNSYKKFLSKYKKEIKNLGLAALNGKDSKKLTEAKRDAWKSFLSGTHARFAYAHMSAGDIDKKGIANCIRRLIQKNLKKLAAVTDCEESELLVLLDGGLKAPAAFAHQKTIIKGDEKELVVGLASIYAKVSRDAYMKKASKNDQFTPYDFHIHKGYGTLSHRIAIKRHGLSSLHRKSFCTRLIGGVR